MYVEHSFYSENRSFMKNSYTKSNITIYYLRGNIITVTYYLQKSNLVILLLT